MKCYFDERRDTQGQCQICGRFASRQYSKIQAGKFVCLECAYGGEEGVLKEVVSILENNAASCGVCGTTTYQWSFCYQQGDFALLWNVVNSAQQELLRDKYVDDRYVCDVCGEKWGEPIQGVR